MRSRKSSTLVGGVIFLAGAFVTGVFFENLGTSIVLFVLGIVFLINGGAVRGKERAEPHGLKSSGTDATWSAEEFSTTACLARP